MERLALNITEFSDVLNNQKFQAKVVTKGQLAESGLCVCGGNW